jgi:hypothetical protein
MIYFGQVASTGLIKIGFSANTERRRREIQAMNGDSFSLLCWIPGGHREEARLHHRFASLRAHGEWFNPGEELLEFIQAISSPLVSPSDSPPSRPPRSRLCQSSQAVQTVEIKNDLLDRIFAVAILKTDNPALRRWLERLQEGDPIRIDNSTEY